MQEVTDRPFWEVLHGHGGPDVYFTEYFRVHRDSWPERHILDTIRHNPSGRPAVAQIIGNDPEHVVRTVGLLEREAIAGIDLNLGCPAPVVYRKNAGGGLLRDPESLDRLLAAVRPAVGVNFSIKTRLGFMDDTRFAELLDVFARHRPDLVTVHGRTVRGGYVAAVDYGRIAEAVRRLPCPVAANGDIAHPAKALEVLRLTGAAAVMIGRGAIRNPWMFTQIKDLAAGRVPAPVTRRMLGGYVRGLYARLRPEFAREAACVAKMKKYLAFIGQGVDAEGRFLAEARAADDAPALERVVARWLDSDEEWDVVPPGGTLGGAHQPRGLSCAG
jgi:tRNA-dihydrouridine synthase